MEEQDRHNIVTSKTCLAKLAVKKSALEWTWVRIFNIRSKNLAGSWTYVLLEMYSQLPIKRTGSIKRTGLEIFKKSLLNVLYDLKF